VLLITDVNMNGLPRWRFVFSECFLVVTVVIFIRVVCGCWQSELVNVGVAYCHSAEERCTLDLDPGTHYYQVAAVGKGKGKVSASFT